MNDLPGRCADVARSLVTVMAREGLLEAAQTRLKLDALTSLVAQAPPEGTSLRKGNELLLNVLLAHCQALPGFACRLQGVCDVGGSASGLALPWRVAVGA